MYRLPTDPPPGGSSAELVTGSRSPDLPGDRTALPQFATLASNNTAGQQETPPPGPHIDNPGPPLRSVYNRIHFACPPCGDEIILVTDLGTIDFTDEHISANPRTRNAFLEKLAILSHHHDRPVLFIFTISKNFNLQRCHRRLTQSLADAGFNTDTICGLFDGYDLSSQRSALCARDNNNNDHAYQRYMRQRILDHRKLSARIERRYPSQSRINSLPFIYLLHNHIHTGSPNSAHTPTQDHPYHESQAGILANHAIPITFQPCSLVATQLFDFISQLLTFTPPTSTTRSARASPTTPPLHWTISEQRVSQPTPRGSTLY